MNRIKNKLRSRTGASITFALLLFLVCAVLCSVILSAATAASGRMAGIAQTDQRYYAVTSACEMMRDLIGKDENAVTIVEKKQTVTTTTYLNGAASTPTSKTTTTYTVKNGTTEGKEFTSGNPEVTNADAVLSLLMNAAISVYQGTTDAWSKTLTITSDSALKTALGAGEGEDPLGVTISASVDKSSGEMTLTVYNTSEDTSTERLTQILVFGLNKTSGGLAPEESVEAEEPSVAENGDISYKVTTTTTTYGTTTYAWTLSSVETKMPPKTTTGS